MGPVRPTLTYLGVGLVAVGFGILVFTWGQIAGLAHVALQMPYLVSGGLVGAGVILTGLTMIVYNTLAQHVVTRDRELAQLTQTLAGVSRLLADDDPAVPGDADDRRHPLRSAVGES